MSPSYSQAATLATLLDRIATEPSLGEVRRREMASAVRTICKVLKAEPHQILAAMSALQPLIRDALPAAFGISGDRWRNCKSYLRRSLSLIDPAALPARSRSSLLLDWAILLDQEAATPVRRGLARFSKWCSDRGVVPSMVTQDIYELFYTELAAHCLLRSPRETQQTAGKAWNVAVAMVPAWPLPTLIIESQRRNPSMPWSDFPASLEASVEAYLAARVDDGKIHLDEDTFFFRSSTITTKRSQLRLFATALVQGGIPASTLTGLDDLVAPHNAKIGLDTLIIRAGERRRGSTFNVAHLLLGIARHEVHAAPAVIATLKKICKSIRPISTGMVQKNRDRLRQFDDQRIMSKYLMLPDRLMRAACSVAVPTASEARIAQHAVALDILTVAPMRIGNIASLELGRTLKFSGRTGFITIAVGEVKNKKDLELPLPESTINMIRLYLKRFHHLLAEPGCSMLFPSRLAKHKTPVTLSTQLKERVRIECGVRYNVHLARYLAALMFLLENPGNYGVVMLLLGHKSMETTTNMYCGTETNAAVTAFQRMIEAKRGKTGRS